LNCSLFSKSFYSAQEFNLRRVFEQAGPYIELGRACIKKDFRTGLVISMLWRGIAEYMTKTNANMLFGCASIKTTSPRQSALLYRYFEAQGYFKSSYFCPPTQAFRMPEFDLWLSHYSKELTPDDLTEAEGLIPTLCKSYLKAGALLGGEPAYDPEFKCIDFLTILPRENLNKSLWKKFSQGQEVPNNSNLQYQQASF
jgi:putative hemolysin